MKDNLIVKIAKNRFNNHKSQEVHFTDNVEANKILINLKKYPHSFVLACLMDRQIKAERAWIIPYSIYKEINSFEIDILFKLKLSQIIKIFNKHKLHRFNNLMANVFHSGVKLIVNKYSGNAANIWNKNPSSSAVVYRFLEFNGCGVKIATMAVNILARQFRIPFSDYYSIDISPDVHIKRVMRRMGFVPNNANNEMIIYKARELNPEFPGIIDYTCWEIGRKWCKTKRTDCINCLVNVECKKIF